MANPIRILAFSGSARRESFNWKFLAAAVAEARAAGAEVTLLDPAEITLPLYNGDLEDSEGMPANATKLVGLVASHGALLIASPEYNSMITPLLKNTLDWCSRADTNPFEGKVAAVISASPGMYGGVRSLQLAQQLLLKLGCDIVPGQCTLPHANNAFDAEGHLTEPHALMSVRETAAKLVALAGKLGA
jgi:chromate reductase, NAD(P)H dehydrogenase (quinone)